MVNINLKILVLKSGQKGYEINQAMGRHASWLSSVINGSYVPDSTEKEDLCSLLECEIEEAFPLGGKGAII